MPYLCSNHGGSPLCQQHFDDKLRRWYAEGLQKGRAEGIEKGRTEERAKAHEEKLASALAIYKSGSMPLEQIAAIMKLDAGGLRSMWAGDEIIIYQRMLIKYTMIDAIKGKLNNVGCLAMIVMAVVMFVFGFCVEILDLDKRSNRDVVEILENRYKYCKSGLNNIVKGCEKLNRTDTISISYSSAHNRFEIEAKYEYLLKEMPFLRGNIRVFRDCFGDIEFSNGWVHFRGSGVKDMNCKFCSLLWCPNAENVDQRYRIFPYGQCPDDKEQYCLYHLEGDWYIRIP